MVYVGFTISVVHFMGFDKYIIIYHASTIMYHTEYFHCPKNPLCSVYSSLPSPDPWQPLIFFYSLHSFAFASMLYS